MGPNTRNAYFQGNPDKKVLEPLLLQTALLFFSSEQKVKSCNFRYYDGFPLQGNLAFDFIDTGFKEEFRNTIQFIISEITFLSSENIQAEPFLTHRCHDIRKLAKSWVEK